MQIEDIYIYHTNDLHSHFEQWPKIVHFLKQRRNYHQLKSESMLYFDIGDHVDRFHPISEATEGKGNVMLLNEAQVDGVTIGNNEGITFSKNQLNRLYQDALFPVLLANLFEKDGQRPEWAKAYKIYELESGMKLGVIGVTIPFEPFYQILGWKIADPFTVIPPLIEELKEKADFIVVLSHLGLGNDEQLAEKVEGIDIILGAHTHHLLKQGKLIKGTIIGQAGKFGTHLGQLKLSVNTNTCEIVEFDIGVIQLENSEDQETIELLQKLEIKEKAVMDKEIILLKKPLTVEWLSDSPAIKLLAEGLKEWCGTELSMVNSGLLLESFPKGKITVGDVHRICPHPINPCVVTINGKRLKETIQDAFTERMKKLPLKGFGFRGEILGQMVFDGIEVEVEKLADNIDHVVSIKIGEEELDVNKEYTIATLDMFTFGKLYPGIAETKHKKYFMPELIREVLIWKLQKSR